MRTYVLLLTEAEIQVLARAIDELPHRLAVPLINRLNEQLARQMRRDDAPANDALASEARMTPNDHASPLESDVNGSRTSPQLASIV